LCNTDFTKKVLGRKGEDVAASFLERHGCRIVARNYRGQAGEIDIIAEEVGSTVRFVEVKTRTSDCYGTPAEAVTYGKQAKIRRTALQWLDGAAPRFYEGLAFDVIEVRIRRGRAYIRWLKDCFF
jgi:putative endonuclease